MSFLSKALSKVGIGAAKVDAVLDTSSLSPGELMTGVINIEGGKVEQQINKLDLDVYCNYFVEIETENDEGEEETSIEEHHCKINSWTIEDSFTIAAGEQKQIPFEFELSHQAPISVGHSTTYLKTNLDIDFALDKSDKDYINVVASPMQSEVFHALEDLGFELVEAECEGYNNHPDDLPFIQEFEFKARGGDFRGRLNELEMVMFAFNDTLILKLEVDRKTKGISGFFAKAFGREEVDVNIELTEDNIADVKDILYEAIDSNS